MFFLSSHQKVWNFKSALEVIKTSICPCKSFIFKNYLFNFSHLKNATWFFLLNFSTFEYAWIAFMRSMLIPLNRRSKLKETKEIGIKNWTLIHLAHLFTAPPANPSPMPRAAPPVRPLRAPPMPPVSTIKIFSLFQIIGS